MRKLTVIIFTTALMLLSCQQGISPGDATPPGATMLKGKIFYKGGKSEWPPKDSCFAVRAVLFKNYPPADIVTEVTNGAALFTISSLPLFADSSEFEIKIPEPATYRYIVVALQTGDSITAQEAVGVYTRSGDNTKPDSIEFKAGRTYNITINVDFKNLPPQPFKK